MQFKRSKKDDSHHSINSAKHLDLTKGPIASTMLWFALPMILGNLLQQCYNIADTWIVGRFLGSDALAAVGSAFSLMTFLTSILLGLCMGSGSLFSICHGQKNMKRLKENVFGSFVLIAIFALVLNAAALLFIDPILRLLQIPDTIYTMMREYLWIIFWGIFATFVYNFFASLLRAVGNSKVPLLFLAVCALLNIFLDILFVLIIPFGVAGAASATVISQYVSAIGIMIYTIIYAPHLLPQRQYWHLRANESKLILQFSFLTSLQQSIMNFGILIVQGLVNSYGTVVMAAFAAAVKIDAFAYMPVQDFGNAFSVFIAQNYGAANEQRIRDGIRKAIWIESLFSICLTAVVCFFAKELMLLFIQPQETAIIAVGVQYLRIEGAFYIGIGTLFLLYGLYRAIGRPGMSVILTIFSLGTRVALAYMLSAVSWIGLQGIWWSVPIGWALADLVGLIYYRRCRKNLLPTAS